MRTVSAIDRGSTVACGCDARTSMATMREREQSESERAQVRVESERPASSPLQHGNVGTVTVYGHHMARAR